MVGVKARRRIRKFIRTGVHQARVYKTSDPKVYEYKVKHYVHSIFYRRHGFGPFIFLRRVKV